MHRDVSTGEAGTTAVATEFSDTLTLFPSGGRGILPTTAEVTTKFAL